MDKLEQHSKNGCVIHSTERVGSIVRMAETKNFKRCAQNVTPQNYNASNNAATSTYNDA